MHKLQTGVPSPCQPSTPSQQSFYNLWYNDCTAQFTDCCSAVQHNTGNSSALTFFISVLSPSLLSVAAPAGSAPAQGRLKGRNSDQQSEAGLHIHSYYAGAAAVVIAANLDGTALSGATPPLGAAKLCSCYSCFSPSPLSLPLAPSWCLHLAVAMRYSVAGTRLVRRGCTRL